MSRIGPETGNWVFNYLTYPGQLVTRYVGNVSSLLARCVIVWLVASILLIASVVLYCTFHYSMMPTMLVTLPVHFQFSPCHDQPEQCAFPKALVYLTDSHTNPLLYSHVHYTISLEIDMPESQANKDAGMFMVRMNMTSLSGKLVGSSSRANILHYRSGLHRAIRTVVLSPLLLTGYSHEQQRITTELFTGYLVHEDEPPVRAQLEIGSVSVQLYGARLLAHARLSGLRRLMYHHPLVTGVLGTAATFATLCMVFLLLWLRTTDIQQTISRQLRMRRAQLAAAGSPLAHSGVIAVDSPAHSDGAAKPDSTWSGVTEASPAEQKGGAAESRECGAAARRELGWPLRLVPWPLSEPARWVFGRPRQKQD